MSEQVNIAQEIENFIQETYQQHLDRMDRYEFIHGKNRFHNAGFCIKSNIWEKRNKAPKKDYQFQSLLRLGTLVGQDFDDAVAHRLLTDKKIGWQVWTDYRVEIPEVNYVGNLDWLLINYERKIIVIIDFKTINHWHAVHKKLFKKTESPEISSGYAQQLGGYAMGVIRELTGKKEGLQEGWSILIANYFYGKNDSSQQLVAIPHSWIEEFYRNAINLEKVDKMMKWDEIKPGEFTGVPYQEWMCSESYCSLMRLGLCEGISKKPKAKKKK